jgi:NTP pyrophosphatase (non-canonical NTP hydrolase)
MFKTLDEIADAVHDLAWEKGWHNESETEDSFIERMCNNLHDEISELHEAWRRNKLREGCDKPIELSCLEEELADIIIRVLDSAKRLNINIRRAIEVKHEYNKTRPYRHGNKRG